MGWKSKENLYIINGFILSNYNMTTIRDNIKIQLDKETKQYYIFNDNTPGTYGLDDSMEKALEEYLSSVKDFIIIEYQKKHETMTFA